MSYSLNDLLASLEADSGMQKQASASATPETVATSLESVLAKKASVDLIKEAQEQGAALAKELLSKVATEIQIANDTMVAEQAAVTTPTAEGTVSQAADATMEKAIASGAQPEDRADQLMDAAAPAAAAETQPTEEDNMKKLAEAIFQKLASEADVQANPIVNKIQEDNAVQDAQAAAKVQPTPEGTVNEVLQAIVAGAEASGAGSENLADGGQPAVDGVSSASVAPTDAASGNEDVEKAAAVDALVGAGFDFDSAVSLVKQAELELQAEAFEHEKIAAFEYLLGEGVDFDQAAALVKEASESLTKEAKKEDSEAWKGLARQAGRSTVEGIAGAAAGGAAGAGIGAIANKLAKGNKPGAALLGGMAGYYTGSMAGSLHGSKTSLKNTISKVRHEKKAEAMGELLAAGIDFDQAVTLVKQASVEVYGE